MATKMKKKKVAKKKTLKIDKLPPFNDYVQNKPKNIRNYRTLLKTKSKLEVVKRLLKEKNEFEGEFEKVKYRVYRDLTQGTYITEIDIPKAALPFKVPSYDLFAKFFGCEIKQNKDCNKEIKDS